MAVSWLSAFSRKHPGGDKIHWRAPTLMITSLVLGIAFAIGHHVFYRSLQSTEVRSTPYQFAGWQITPQQLNTAGGTAFAFAVKASLVLAISTAYMQLFFRTIAKVSYEMARIDRWFSGLSDITSLFGLTTFWTRPLLGVIALTVWLLPIAAIITPATLSVTFDHLPPIEQSHFVPVPAFASLKIGRYLMNDLGELGSLQPSAEATRIAQAAATAGSILPIAPPALNASWLVTMLAPRLDCQLASGALLNAIKDNIAGVMGPWVSTVRSANGSEEVKEEVDAHASLLMNMFSYLVWPSTSCEVGHPDEMPFNTTFQPSGQKLTALERADKALEDGLDWFRDYTQDVLYVAALPRMMTDSYEADFMAFLGAMEGLNISTAEGARKAMDWVFEKATTVRCQLLQSEYTLRFAYTGPSQEQTIEIVHVEDVAKFQVRDDW